MAHVGHTLAEKILLAHTEADDLAPGDFVMVRCDVVMANDLGGPLAARELARMSDRVFDPEKIVLVADHFMPAKDTRSAELQKTLKDWARAQGVAFYDQGRGGIEHTVLVEEGWIVPGSVVVGSDSHTCTYGALGAFGTGMGATDIAGCMAIGTFWQIVPGTIVVELAGEKQGSVAGKDLILAVIAELGVAGATNMALEFVGDGATSLTIDERLAVSNMAVEAGADTGLFPADEVTAAYLEDAEPAVGGGALRRRRGGGPARQDRRPRPAAARRCPALARQRRAARRRARRRIDQVYIGNCANGMTDLRQAAEVCATTRSTSVAARSSCRRHNGSTVKPSPRACSTSSSRPAASSRRRRAAPASAATAACSPRARPRSRRRTATSRAGRGHPTQRLPRERLGGRRGRRRRRDRRSRRADWGNRVIIEGRALVIAQDNVDTDVLYPGQYLNVLDVGEMATHLFEGLDPALRDQLTDDTILVAGENFGNGLSRVNLPIAMGRGYPMRRGEELRPHLPSQLHQPRPPGDRVPPPPPRPRRPVRVSASSRTRARSRGGPRVVRGDASPVHARAVALGPARALDRRAACAALRPRPRG